MYDSLLDELEDDVTPHSDETAELVDKGVDVDDTDDDLLVEDPAAIADLEVDGKAEELLSEEEDIESWSDDPVRMYLTQMGEIPLLTRQQEITLAKKIEITRACFRRKLLACDYVIQIAVKILNRVHRGELPFDRTVQVSVTDRLEKDQILGRLPHNLVTVQSLLRRNKADYRLATSKSAKMTLRREAWQRLGRRRLRAVKLVEELGLRTQRIEPLIRTLEEFSRRLDELKSPDRRAQAAQAPGGRTSPMAEGFPQYPPHHARDADEPAQPRQVSSLHLFRLPTCQARPVGGKLAAGGVDCQEVSQPRLELLGPDPGRQRRLDASGR